MFHVRRTAYASSGATFAIDWVLENGRNETISLPWPLAVKLNSAKSSTDESYVDEGSTYGLESLRSMFPRGSYDMYRYVSMTW